MNQMEIMLELMRASIFDREPVVDIPDDIDWDKMMDEADRQHILGWVWDGICKLPKENRPTRQQCINWGLSAQEIADHYEKQRKLLKYLLEECDKNGMRMLMFKGLDFARLYPKPELRKYGDIDCYLFGDYDKFNTLFVEHLDKDHKTEIHAELIFDGLLVENHCKFVYTTTRQRKKINDFLMTSMNDATKSDGGFWVFSPMAYLVYITQHATNHFFIDANLPIRSLVDFALWLRTHASWLHPEDCHAVLGRLGIEKGFEILLYLSEEILGVSFDEYILGHVSKKHIDTLKDLISSGYDISSLPKAEESGVKAYIKVLRIRRTIKRHMLRYESGFFNQIKAFVIGYTRALLRLHEGVSLKVTLKNLAKIRK